MSKIDLLDKKAYTAGWDLGYAKGQLDLADTFEDVLRDYERGTLSAEDLQDELRGLIDSTRNTYKGEKP